MVVVRDLVEVKGLMWVVMRRRRGSIVGKRENARIAKETRTIERIEMVLVCVLGEGGVIAWTIVQMFSGVRGLAVEGQDVFLLWFCCEIQFMMDMVGDRSESLLMYCCLPSLEQLWNDRSRLLVVVNLQLGECTILCATVLDFNTTYALPRIVALLSTTQFDMTHCRAFIQNLALLFSIYLGSSAYTHNPFCVFEQAHAQE